MNGQGRSGSLSLTSIYLGFIYFLQITYLSLLPVLATLAVITRDYDSPLLRFAGWIPAVVFAAIVVSMYTLTKRPLKAFFVVSAVPLQILAVTLLWDGSIWLFFLEAACVELAGLCFALAITMLIYRPTGWYGAIVGIALAAIVFYGWSLPLIEWKSERGPQYWWVPLAIATATAVWGHLQQLIPRAIYYAETGETLPSRLFSEHEEFFDLNLENFAAPVIFAMLGIWFVLFLTPLLSLFFET